MILVIGFAAALMLAMIICVKLGEDNIKSDLMEILLEELQEIDPADPTAEIKAKLLEKIKDAVI